VHFLVVMVGGQHQNLGNGHFFGQSPRALDAAGLGHGDVQEDHIGQKTLSLLQDRFAIRGFTDDFDVLGHLDQMLQSLAHDRMIVGNQNGYLFHMCVVAKSRRQHTL